MRSRIPLAAAAWLLCSGALAAEPPAAAPPEEQAASGGTHAATPDPYAELNKRMQEKLKALGFYDGPVNGDVGPYTQAALAQFQLSVPMPVSGSLDAATLLALGLEDHAPIAEARTDAPPPIETAAEPPQK